ncbi:M23 family metallopeptidase [Denitromonas iodatirespirans]|uniref:M23 family metallopeptidase n=1 Tax=Denitromonas iodatirespirans TaxID=2795389 RepID=A0A944DCN8_DENI1|nr:M23 family metallopeptidase [Denitromonas iodatirespirans]MBT0964064.1 M23 family metallopeptidase [Denitromonas iodatirespirans]
MPPRKQEILADHANNCAPGVSRRWLLTGIASALSLSVAAAIAVVPNRAPDVSARPISESLGTPQFSIAAANDLPFVLEDRVKRGDTLETIFQRFGIKDAEAIRFMQSTESGRLALRQLRAGRPATATVAPDGSLIELTLPQTRGDGNFALERKGASFATKESQQELASIVEMRSGTIRHSLFGATESAGLPDAVATRLAELFGTEIDFRTDLRTGDRFSVVYETLVQEDGRPSGIGRILAAEFVNQGKRHAVVLYRGKDGQEDYYTEDGHSLKQAFLRFPLEFTRVTSGFSQRFHPILKQWRQHKGVDFGAPSGSAIKATSNGTVEFVGVKGGYGNVVILRHRDNISTLYAHMRGFASTVRKGASVSQGDVIGYVGQSGWATGPHLHYEFRVNNVARDPMSIALPTAKPLAKGELHAFKAATENYRKRIALLNPDRTIN